MLDKITGFLEGLGFNDGFKTLDNPTKLWSQATKHFVDAEGRVISVTVFIPCREHEESPSPA